MSNWWDAYPDADQAQPAAPAAAPEQSAWWDSFPDAAKDSVAITEDLPKIQSKAREYASKIPLKGPNIMPRDISDIPEEWHPLVAQAYAERVASPENADRRTYRQRMQSAIVEAPMNLLNMQSFPANLSPSQTKFYRYLIATANREQPENPYAAYDPRGITLEALKIAPKLTMPALFAVESAADTQQEVKAAGGTLTNQLVSAGTSGATTQLLFSPWVKRLFGPIAETTGWKQAAMQYAKETTIASGLVGADATAQDLIQGFGKWAAGNERPDIAAAVEKGLTASAQSLPLIGTMHAPRAVAGYVRGEQRVANAKVLDAAMEQSARASQAEAKLQRDRQRQDAAAQEASDYNDFVARLDELRARDQRIADRTATIQDRAESFAEENPDGAMLLKAIKDPTRADFKKAGLREPMSAGERSEFTSRLQELPGPSRPSGLETPEPQNPSEFRQGDIVKLPQGDWGQITDVYQEGKDLGFRVQTTNDQFIVGGDRLWNRSLEARQKMPDRPPNAPEIPDSSSPETPAPQATPPSAEAVSPPAPAPVEAPAATGEAGPVVSPREALKQYEAEKGYDQIVGSLQKGYRSQKNRDLMNLRDSDPQWQELQAADKGAARRDATAFGRQVAQENRDAALQKAEAGEVDAEVMKYAPIHTLPEEVRGIIRQGAEALLPDTDSPKIKAALQKIVEDAGSDKGAEVENQKERIVGKLSGKIGGANKMDEPWPVDPMVELFTMKPTDRAEVIDQAVQSIQEGKPNALADRADKHLGESSGIPFNTPDEVVGYLQSLRGRVAEGQAPEFQLQNAPSKPAKWTGADAGRERQGKMFSGMNALPGQMDLIQDLDKPAEPAAARAMREADAELSQQPEVRFAGPGITPPLQKVRPDVIPDSVKVDAPEVETRMEKSRGVKPESLLSKASGLVSAGFRKMTRAQENIPLGGEWAVANEHFRLLKVIPDQVSDEVNRTVAAIIDPMGPNQRSLFERKLIADNMLASIDRGEPLRFGFKSREEVAAYQQKLDAMVAKTPEVQKALENRKQVVGEFVKELVDYDLLPEGAAEKSDTYFHQQVLSYMQADRLATGGRKPMKIKRSFQKGRVEGTELPEEADYNTDYIQAEAKWMTDARIELAKEKWLRSLNEKQGLSIADLKQEAASKDVPWQDLIKDTHSLWQPEPGNQFYSVTTIPERLAEKLHQGLVEELSLTEDQLRSVLAIMGPKRQFVLPNEVVAQLKSMEKPKASGPIGDAATELLNMWKAWTLQNPKRALAYNLRNFLGDAEGVMMSAPGAFKYTTQALEELRGYHGQKLAMSPELKAARDLGVISSGLTAQEIPDLQNLKVFKRFYQSKPQLMDMAGKYFEKTKELSELRENTLRYAAYLYYRDALKADTLTHYGAARKDVVQALKAEMGVDVAAAHLARNLLGDYGNMTVMGQWARAKAYPFWSWVEINLKRFPRQAINAVEMVKTKNAESGPAVAALYSAYALMGMAGFYAAQYAWNNLVHPDQEQNLPVYDRANPHIDLGYNSDGSSVIFRNAGNLGDFLEWFGINSAINLYPKYRDGQITLADLATEMAKDPINKVVGGSRPDLKAALEVGTGRTTFPDVFQSRPIDRGEAAAGLFGLQDELKAVRGAVTQSGEKARPNYWERWMFGVSDPRQNALNEIHELRGDYLKKEGKDRPSDFAASPTKTMREAAMAGDFEAFKKARDAYLASGHKYDGFLQSIGQIDPVAHRLSNKDEIKFEKEFLNGLQREKLQVARDYARNLEVTLFTWWHDAATPEEKVDLRKKHIKTLRSPAIPQSRKAGESAEEFRMRRSDAVGRLNQARQGFNLSKTQ